MADMAFVLPDLPSFTLPSLPSIADSELNTLALTHKSNHQSPRRATDIDVSQDDKIVDYEKLEHVGDAILGSIVTTLLHELFLQLQPGPATLLKGCLVANSTLAQLSSRYSLPDKIIAAPAALYTTRMQVKVRASVLEAYIAAVFYDFLISEVPGAYEVDAVSDDDTVSCAGATADNESVRDDITEVGGAQSVSGESIVSEMGTLTIKDSDSEEGSGDGFHNHVTHPTPEHLGSSAFPPESRLAPLPPLRPVPMRSRGEAYDYVECWLRPLFIPIAHFALEQVRSSASIIQNKWAGDSEYIAGATGCLNSWAMKTTGGDMPTYIHSRAGARWKAECRVVDEDGAEHMSEAVRDTKQSAKQHAAYMLCRELGLDIGEK